MNSPVVDKLKNYLPKIIRQPVKSVYLKLKKARLEMPSVTVYLNRSDVKTFICVNNFYSWMAVSAVKNAVVKVVFYSPEGKEILKFSEKLSYFGSTGIDVADLFQKNGIKSQHGMFTLNVEPTDWRTQEYKDAGIFKSLFFNFYQHQNGSVSMVHPNSRLGSEPPVPNEEWPSSQLIITKGIKMLRLYQMMPVSHDYPVTYTFFDPSNGRTIAEKSVVCKPFSSTEMEFDLSNIKDMPPELRLKMSAWPINNSKPVIERVFTSGLCSLSHT